MFLVFFFFKQKTAYEMRISDWSSDVCSSDLRRHDDVDAAAVGQAGVGQRRRLVDAAADLVHDALGDLEQMLLVAELDRRDLELALFFDIGLFRAVDHVVAAFGIGQPLLQRSEAGRVGKGCLSTGRSWGSQYH